ncbi:MAG: nucleotidyltransferase family protein [Ruminococcus sp.]|nr:nucleotidyltransferase family protein [Ruminococcus sp.]
MQACGIIAEFDPFHNGHKYLLDRARASGSTHIAVVMSGSTVQRGTVSFCDKFFRAETAVRNGADLVLELPAPYSCSNAEVFASAGVRALDALGEGVISRLVFGSEIADTSVLVRASEAADSLKDSESLKEFCRGGDSYPLAVCKACELEYGKTVAEVFRYPNSTLAVEYCRALRAQAHHIEPFAVEREGAAHGSDRISGSFASASLIRSMLQNGENVSGLLPEVPDVFCKAERLDSLILYRLLSAEAEDILALPDSNEALANRFLKAAASCPASTEAFFEACKSKSFTLSRLRRLALHLVLGVRKEDIVPLPYSRILAFNERGREILAAGEHTLPIDTSLAALEQSSPAARRVSLLERRGSLLFAAGSGIPPVNEYKKQIRIM